MRPGDLVRWKKTGKVCVYLGRRHDMHQFYSDEYGIVERWVDALKVIDAHTLEVISESR